jgi:hypothetical protein
VYASVPPFPPAPARVLPFGHPPCPPFCLLGRHSDLPCYCMSLGCLSSRFPRRSFSAFIPYGQLSWKWPGSPQLQHADCLWSLLHVWGDGLPQNILALVLWGRVTGNTACSSRPCLRASFTVYLIPEAAGFFYGGVFYPVGERLACLPFS